MKTKKISKLLMSTLSIAAGLTLMSTDVVQAAEKNLNVQGRLRAWMSAESKTPDKDSDTGSTLQVDADARFGANGQSVGNDGWTVGFKLESEGLAGKPITVNRDRWVSLENDSFKIVLGNQYLVGTYGGVKLKYAGIKSSIRYILDYYLFRNGVTYYMKGLDGMEFKTMLLVNDDDGAGRGEIGLAPSFRMNITDSMTISTEAIATTITGDEKVNPQVEGYEKAENGFGLLFEGNFGIGVYLGMDSLTSKLTSATAEAEEETQVMSVMGGLNFAMSDISGVNLELVSASEKLDEAAAVVENSLSLSYGTQFADIRWVVGIYSITISNPDQTKIKNRGVWRGGGIDGYSSTSLDIGTVYKF
ncbi:MAG: hypothetical protein HQM11_16895 [SAR324 cluster bacterium]|nr:hypothetical protein [SAR324 cluster bacterium]